jgi:glycosyltransferase involved in cell wall biosynthesis
MKVAIVSEFNLAVGSGYTTIARAIAAGLGQRGHDVKVLGIDYNGYEHRLPITVLGADERFLIPHLRQLDLAWGIDAVVVTHDITRHLLFRPIVEAGYPYVGIFPLESDPLMHPSEWTRTIDGMGAALVESAWATQLCVDVGLTVRHIPIGVDSEFWRSPTPEERDAIRARLGVADRFVLLTVSDNHERKNLPAVFATAALLQGRDIEWPAGSGRRKVLRLGELTLEQAAAMPLEETLPALAEQFATMGDPPPAGPGDYWLIINTKRRPESVGYHLWDLANTFQLQNETTFYQHEHYGGLNDEELRNLYWAADCFVLLSKAEGLGLPVMEAMACGLPCVCTDTGGMAENLADGRGWLVPAEYSHIDPFCNQIRRYADPYEAAKAIADLRARHDDRAGRVVAALEWARDRTWGKALDVLEEALDGLVKAKTEQAGAAPPAAAYAGALAGGNPATR